MGNFKQKIVALFAASLALSVGTASAAVPAGVTTFFTELTADSTTITDYAWPIVLVITGTFIAIKLTKKTANKAT